MNRLQDRVVLITGASAGIGAACAHAFAESGSRLVLAARRSDRLEALVDSLPRSVDVRTYPLDVRDPSAVAALMADLDSVGWDVDVLVNNAGLARGLAPLHEGELSDWNEMIDTNVKGVLHMMRAVVPGMVARNRGHVIQIGSIAGFQVYPRGNVYNASKFAVRALNEGLNLDLVGTAVRVSSVDPGLVETEFSEVRFHGDRERAQNVYQGYTPLRAEDVADVVRYVANAPPHVNILELILLPTDQRNAYVLHKDAD